MLSKEQKLFFLRQALDLARKSHPQPTNYRVGAVLVSEARDQNSSPAVLSTGYTLELPGNTHAEECAIVKLAASHSVSEMSLHEVLTAEMNVTMFTTLEPCANRLSGKLPCVDRVSYTRGLPHGNDRWPKGPAGIRNVVFGAKEPDTFVMNSASCRHMTEAEIAWEYMPDYENEILNVATEGHKNSAKQETNIDDIDEDERKRQEQIPRNPKKRMMEVPFQP